MPANGERGLRLSRTEGARPPPRRFHNSSSTNRKFGLGQLRRTDVLQMTAVGLQVTLIKKIIGRPLCAHSGRSFLELPSAQSI
jgi:hypothetical protein